MESPPLLSSSFRWWWSTQEVDKTIVNPTPTTLDKAPRTQGVQMDQKYWNFPWRVLQFLDTQKKVAHSCCVRTPLSPPLIFVPKVLHLIMAAGATSSWPLCDFLRTKLSLFFLLFRLMRQCGHEGKEDLHFFLLPLSAQFCLGQSHCKRGGDESHNTPREYEIHLAFRNFKNKILFERLLFFSKGCLRTISHSCIKLVIFFQGK